jgi:hypothetical protein
MVFKSLEKMIIFLALTTHFSAQPNFILKFTLHELEISIALKIGILN